MSKKLNSNLFNQLLTVSFVFALSYINASQAVSAQETCTDSQPPREFHISITPQQDNLEPIPQLAAVGGTGEFALLQAQQSTPDGYRVVQITPSDFDNNGIEAELIAADFDRGMVSFSACTDKGFLLLAGFRNSSDEWAGFPAGVISGAHSVNFANLTPKLDSRIGSTFRTTGADETLAIAESILEEDLGISGELDRRLAQRILTLNASTVFDIAELQAPVFNFAEGHCQVVDNFIHFKIDASCSAFANTAVIDILDETGSSILSSSSGTVSFSPNETYIALIPDGENIRSIPFGTVLLEDELVFSVSSCSFFGCQPLTFPYTSSLTASISVSPIPEWFDLRSYTLTVSSGILVVENFLANVVSGPAEDARISGLSAGTIQAGESVDFTLQTRRSTSQSRIEFGFDVQGIDGNPRTFFVEARVTTN